MSNEDLRLLIADKVNELCLKNEKQEGIISQLTAQIAVYATLQVLEELGLLTLTTKTE